jgi:hypothetical protein
MSLKKCKGKSVTNTQKETLVEFMENNMDLKRGKFTPALPTKRLKMYGNK